MKTQSQYKAKNCCSKAIPTENKVMDLQRRIEEMTSDKK